ncbi:MAG: hypothetical protein G01um101472_502 [Parcubacteria group bacterium Gr01-1014_72]|nr:MAG: hypothetical protein G01um101472_502 [Parcubacteria group bacterium Gr01-1014_72]
MLECFWVVRIGGPERTRTAYLLIANEAFYQMNYGPEHKIHCTAFLCHRKTPRCKRDGLFPLLSTLYNLPTTNYLPSNASVSTWSRNSGSDEPTAATAFGRSDSVVSPGSVLASRK